MCKKFGVKIGIKCRSEEDDDPERASSYECSTCLAVPPSCSFCSLRGLTPEEQFQIAFHMVSTREKGAFPGLVFFVEWGRFPHG